ncbi:MAG: glycosyltransferase family 1 protein [Ignavibacteriaceae bacterium]
MRIGYYIHHTSLKAGGIFTYSIGILKLLIKSNEIEEIHLIISSDQEKYFQKIVDNPKIKFNVVDRKNLIVNTRFAVSYLLSNAVALYRNFFKRPNHLKLLSKLSVVLNPYSKYITRSQIDLLHVPQQYSPIYNSDVPVIITMHDIQEYHYPEYFTTSQKLHRKINNINAINESDHIIVSFDHIKNDLLKYFDVKESKISICPPPFADNWFTSKQETKWEELSKNYNLRKNYLLYPAATWEHKNHISLVKVLKQLRDKGNDIELVCTGNKTKYFSKIESVINELKLSPQIHFLGIVPEADLIGLYKNSSLVVIPTLYEAGSGPLYEAMRYRVPVICSIVTSLPETMGSDEFIFNPKNVNSLSKLITRILSDEKLKKENLLNSERRMVEMAKQDYVKNFYGVYEKII